MVSSERDDIERAAVPYCEGAAVGYGRASAESDRELQEWIGHADARTTARYTHHRPRKDAAQRLARSFEPETADVPVNA